MFDDLTEFHKDIAIYLLQNIQREPIDITLMAEDFSGARVNPLAERDMNRGQSQETTTLHGTMRERLLAALQKLEDFRLVEVQSSLMVSTRRLRLTKTGRIRAEVWLEEKRKKQLL
jgi:hypothetical protein